MHEKKSADPSGSHEISASSGAVLLADDEFLIRSSTKRLLERSGYTVFEAVDGLQAVSVLEENRDAIGVVLLDLVMPGPGAKKTFLRLQSVKAGLPVIITSGYALDEKAQELLDLGAVGFIAKPFDFQTLANEIARVKP